MGLHVIYSGTVGAAEEAAIKASTTHHASSVCRSGLMCGYYAHTNMSPAANLCASSSPHQPPLAHVCPLPPPHPLSVFVYSVCNPGPLPNLCMCAILLQVLVRR